MPVVQVELVSVQRHGTRAAMKVTLNQVPGALAFGLDFGLIGFLGFRVRVRVAESSWFRVWEGLGFRDVVFRGCCRVEGFLEFGV